MKRPYFTRKNFIVLALAIFYAIIIFYTGICIEAGHSLVSKRNVINQLALMLKFEEIDASLAGFVGLVLMAIYIILFIASVIYVRRYCIENGKRTYGVKALFCYAFSFLACAALSVGLTVLLVSPKTWDNVSTTLLFLWQAFILGTGLSVAVGLLIGGIAMLVINFILIDKPFRFFNKNEMEVVEEDGGVLADVDVATSFDVQADGNVGGVGGGAGNGNISGSGELTSVKAAESLDSREKVFPSLSAIDVRYSGYEVGKLETDEMTLEELCQKFRNYLASVEHLYFDIDTIRVFISGFAASHFMILEGLSGTGKSSLPRYFAKFVGGNVLFLPVQATWRDKSNILGFFNDFSRTYTETDFLAWLYNANYDNDRIHVFVLDEMNISRVEYYFADLLSVLEYPKEDWKLRLMQLPHDFVPPARITDGCVQITPNCYFVGTANKDDSTFSIADKVYDRAITIDFEYRNKPFTVEEKVAPVKLSASKLQELYTKAAGAKENAMTEADYKKFEALTEFVYDQFDITFGNRILTQIETLVPVYIACGGRKEEILDFLFARKVLAKIEGRFEEYVKNALKQLLVLINKTYGANVFVRSEKAINSLIRKL